MKSRALRRVSLCTSFIVTLAGADSALATDLYTPIFEAGTAELARCQLLNKGKSQISFDVQWVSASGEVLDEQLRIVAGAGQGRAPLALPPGLGAPLPGSNLTFAYLLVAQFDFASRAVPVALR